MFAPKSAALSVAPIVLIMQLFALAAASAQDAEAPPNGAVIRGDGPHWVALAEKDFVNVNGKMDTWSSGRAASSIVRAIP